MQRGKVQVSIDPLDGLRPKRMLICGLGSIGRRHLRLLRKEHPLLEIAVFRSGIGPSCTEVELADHIFTDLGDAIDWGSDAAVIASPAPFHLQQALPLAREGIPLLIEKPVGTGLESGEAWRELCLLEQQLPISVAYVLRHDPCAEFVRHKLRSQCLGRLIDVDFYCGSWLPDWRPDLDYRNSVSARSDLGGGVLMELSHELDLANWLFGKLTLEYALLQQSGLLAIDVEDVAVLVARDPHDTCVTIRLNFCTHPSRRVLSVRGQQGELIWDLISHEVRSSTDGQPDQIFRSSTGADDRYRLQLQNFFACLTGKEAPKCSLGEGLSVLALVNQARSFSIQLEGARHG
jgi:predicted dehydrogenase